MRDDELIALNWLFEHLLNNHYEAGCNLFLSAAHGDASVAADMRARSCLMHTPARRAMRECNTVERA
ncbi:hypothetical protein [Bordetella sp. 2513F-2]